MTLQMVLNVEKSGTVTRTFEHPMSFGAGQGSCFLEYELFQVTAQGSCFSEYELFQVTAQGSYFSEYELFQVTAQ